MLGDRRTTITVAERQATISRTKLKVANSLRLLREFDEQQRQPKRV
jgi:hypothetical protein